MSPLKQPRDIPLYAYDGALVEYTYAERIARLETCGLVRVIRHKKGMIARAIFYAREGDPRPADLRDYVGQEYSFKERLDDGHRVWKLKRLGKGDELRPIFLRVLNDCLVSGRT